MQAGQTDYAKQLLDGATRYYPESPLIMAQKAKYEFTAGNTADALELFKIAVLRHPTSRLLWDDFLKVATIAGNGALQVYAQQNLDRLNAYVSGN